MFCWNCLKLRLTFQPVMQKSRVVVGMYNFLTSEKGSLVIKKCWEKAGITGLLDGSTEIQSEDPFEDL